MTSTRRLAAVALTAANTLLAILAVLAIYVPASTHEAPEGLKAGGVEAWSVMQEREDLPVNVPTWDRETAAAFPACEAPVEGEIPAAVIVVQQDGDTVRTSLDAADAVAHDAEPANDVWVVGACY